MRLTILLALLTVLTGCSSIKVLHMDDSMKMRFKTEEADVLFYGSNNGFTPIPAVKDGKWWEITMNDTDKLRYFLKADGEIFLPPCKMKELDDFGGELCIYER